MKTTRRLWFFAIVVALAFSAPAIAAEHPFLIVKQDKFTELQGRASQPPWKEMKATAISMANSLTYPVAGTKIDKSKAMIKIMNYTALAYIVDPANRVTYKNKIRDTISHWSTHYPTLDHAVWADTVLGGSAYFMSVVALDIIYNDLTTTERTNAENILAAAQNGWNWPLNRYGAPLAFALFKGDRARIDSLKQLYRKEIFPPGDGNLAESRYVTADGAYPAGINYSWQRLAGGHDCCRAAKVYTRYVLEHTGEDSYYSTSVMRNFNRWLFTFGTTPFRTHTVFGDTENAITFNAGRNYFLDRYSAESAALASWYVNGALPNSEASLFTYILMTKQLPPGQKPTSQIFNDGGAAFWEKNSSELSLMGAMLNQTNSEWHTHKEVNSINLIGYGEYLLVNAGYAGAMSVYDAGGFDRAWIARNANSGNTVLIDRKDHLADIPPSISPVPGAGVTEGFVTAGLDYASGDSGKALPNGKHQRNFIFIHPQDGKNGYWLLFDEVNAISAALTTANVLLHPNSNSFTTIASEKEYQWKINGPFKRQTKDTFISIFLGTSPKAQSVLLKDSVWVRRDGYIINKYLDATFATDALGKANIATVLFPHDPTHAKANMVRLSGNGFTGASIDHGNSILDFALANSSTGTVQHGLVSFKGKASAYRLNNGLLSFYFVRQGTSFNDGTSQRRGFSSAANVSVYMKNTAGKIISPGTNVTFYYPGLTGVNLNGQTFSGATVSIPAGTHDISLVVGQNLPPAAPKNLHVVQ
ncbi:MAG: heparinase II/III family protein [Deltaproteobacteria bacterium]|nr:heparinase II/III family protein [Deltaproteobacteria bacterium]